MSICFEVIMFKSHPIFVSLKLFFCTLKFIVWLLNYILCKRGSWWMEWQRYVGLVSSEEHGTEQLPQAKDRPGEIDNSKLVSAETINGSEEPELLRTLRDGQDYTLVPQEVWRRLYEWY